MQRFNGNPVFQVLMYGRETSAFKPSLSSPLKPALSHGASLGTSLGTGGGGGSMDNNSGSFALGALVPLPMSVFTTGPSYGGSRASHTWLATWLFSVMLRPRLGKNVYARS